MGERMELLQRYRQAFALGQNLLAVLAGPVSGEESVDLLIDMLAQRKGLLEECGNLVGAVEHADEAVVAALQDLIDQQRELEEAWAASLQRLQQASAQSRQARQTLQGVRRLLSTGSHSRLVDQRR
ncbi:MAG TPA: hypothetical protein VIL07_11430 [Symbiobacteriaceae bacterium]